MQRNVISYLLVIRDILIGLNERYRYVRNLVLQEQNNKIGHGLRVFSIKLSNDIPAPLRESKVLTLHMERNIF